MVYGEPGGAAAAQPSEPPQPAGNYFLRRGRCWAARFGDGDEKLYLPEVGCEYLHVLLSHPGREFTASELETRIRGARGVRPGDVAAEAVASGDVGTGGAAAETVLDVETVRAYRVRLEEIEEALPLARESGCEGALEVVEQLEAERRSIEDQLRRAHGLGGRARTLGPDDREKVRKRVCAALTRTRKQIAKEDRLLGEHLNSPGLTLGHHILYTPRGGDVWMTHA